MRKSSVSCPVCHRKVLKTDQVIYFEVEDLACRVVNFKEVPPDTEKIICAVHETCAKEFKKMVAVVSTRRSIQTDPLSAQFGKYLSVFRCPWRERRAMVTGRVDR